MFVEKYFGSLSAFVKQWVVFHQLAYPAILLLVFYLVFLEPLGFWNRSREMYTGTELAFLKLEVLPKMVIYFIILKF